MGINLMSRPRSCRKRDKLILKIERIKSSIKNPVNKGKETLSDAKLKSLELELKHLNLNNLRYREALFCGRFYLWMRYPEEKLRNMDKVAIRQTFPYNLIRLFNKEPVWVRNKLGEYSFEGIMKVRNAIRCHHKVDSIRQIHCKYCRIGGIDSDIEYNSSEFSSLDLMLDSKTHNIWGILKQGAVQVANIYKRTKKIMNKNAEDLILKINESIINNLQKPSDAIIRKVAKQTESDQILLSGQTIIDDTSETGG